MNGPVALDYIHYYEGGLVRFLSTAKYLFRFKALNLVAGVGPFVKIVEWSSD